MPARPLLLFACLACLSSVSAAQDADAEDAAEIAALRDELVQIRNEPLPAGSARPGIWADRLRLCPALSRPELRVRWLLDALDQSAPAGRCADLPQFRARLADCAALLAELKAFPQAAEWMKGAVSPDLAKSAAGRIAQITKDNLTTVSIDSQLTGPGGQPITAGAEITVDNDALKLTVSPQISTSPSRDVSGALWLLIRIIDPGTGEVVHESRVPSDDLGQLAITSPAIPLELPTTAFPEPGTQRDLRLELSIESAAPEDFWPLQLPTAPFEMSFSIARKSPASVPVAGESTPGVCDLLREFTRQSTSREAQVLALGMFHSKKNPPPTANERQAVLWLLGDDAANKPACSTTRLIEPIGNVKFPTAVDLVTLLQEIEQYKAARVGLKADAVQLGLAKDPLGYFFKQGSLSISDGHQAVYAAVIDLVVDQNDAVSGMLLTRHDNRGNWRYDLSRFQSLDQLLNKLRSIGRDKAPALIAIDAGLGRDRFNQIVDALPGRTVSVVPALASITMSRPAWDEEAFRGLALLQRMDPDSVQVELKQIKVDSKSFDILR